MIHHDILYIFRNRKSDEAGHEREGRSRMKRWMDEVG